MWSLQRCKWQWHNYWFFEKSNQSKSHKQSSDSCCILYVLWWSYFILCFVYFNHLFLIHIGNNLDSDIIVLCINSKLFPKQINITSKSHRPSSKFSWWCFQKSFFSVTVASSIWERDKKLSHWWTWVTSRPSVSISPCMDTACDTSMDMLF